MEQDIRFCKTSDGVRIAYATLGSEPPLVWLVGWLSHLELDANFPPYRERCERLSENFTLVKHFFCAGHCLGLNRVWQAGLS